MGNKQEKRFTGQKLLYMLFALLTAIVLWLYVSITDMPDITRTVSGIKVETIGAETLTERNLVATKLSRETVSITFNGSREQIYELDNTNVKVVIDLSNITTSGQQGIRAYPEYDQKLKTSSLSVVSISSDYIEVTVENVVPKNVVVRGVNEGSVADGYIANRMTVAPETIDIVGPESVIKQVAYAQAVFSETNLTGSTSVDTPVVLMDTNDEPVSMDNITLSSETVTLSMQVNMLKNIPLTVNFVYGAGTTADNNTVSYKIEPASVELSGDTAVLQELESIVTTTVDLNQFESTTELTVPIMIPNDCENLTGTAEATITVEISNLETAKLSVKNISITNDDTSLSTEVITQSLDVTLRGTAEDLAKVTADNVRIVADLTDVKSTIGTHAVPARINVDGVSGVGAIGNNTVTVRIAEKSAATADTADETADGT
jgi:YbbR domain-containing protein